MVVVKGFLFMHVTNSDDGNVLRSMLPDIQAAGIISKILCLLTVPYYTLPLSE